MKTNVFFRMLWVTMLAFVGLSSCLSDMDEEKRKTTDYKEYELTVASVRLPGVLSSSGSNLLEDVFAVKRENHSEWEAMGGIGGFDYEEGFEYRIRISETSYLDERMGDPAWTEFSLMEVISKEHKDSERLPMNFIPAWFFEHNAYIDPEFVYAVEADDVEEIENDLQTNDTYRFENCRYYLCVGDKWFKQSSDMETMAQGVILRKEKDSSDFPESYKYVMPQDYQMVASGGLDFVTVPDEEPVMGYDFWISRQFPTKSDDVEIYLLWLFKDLTTYYQRKFPEANVKAVAIRYALKM